MKARRAFTLIELLLVVIIIGALSAMAVPKLYKRMVKSKPASRAACNTLVLSLHSTGWPSMMMVVMVQERELAPGEFRSFVVPGQRGSPGRWVAGDRVELDDHRRRRSDIADGPPTTCSSVNP